MLDELEAHFLAVPILGALGIVYPQYWVQEDYKLSFYKHLTIIKDFYGKSRITMLDRKQILVPPVLDKFRLESEQPLFKMAMIANSP